MLRLKSLLNVFHPELRPQTCNHICVIPRSPHAEPASLYSSSCPSTAGTRIPRQGREGKKSPSALPCSALPRAGSPGLPPPRGPSPGQQPQPGPGSPPRPAVPAASPGEGSRKGKSRISGRTPGGSARRRGKRPAGRGAGP